MTTTRAVAVAKLDENGTPITVPVAPEVAEVIHEWAQEHAEDLNERLAPFGLGNYNIARPEYRRVVTEGEEIAKAIDNLSIAAGLSPQDAADIAATALRAFDLVAAEAMTRILGDAR